MIYRGIPYIAFGSRSEWTNGKSKIEKVWRPFPYSGKYDWLATIHFRWTIVLKVRLFDADRPFTDKVIRVANMYADKRDKCYSYIDGSEIEPVGGLVPKSAGNFFRMQDYHSKQDGSCIGNAAIVYRLVTKFGITEFYDYDESKHASLGWSPKNRKWYGWSHRALAGFGIGSERVEGDIAFDEYGYMKASTIEDARLMAEQFARDVS